MTGNAGRKPASSQMTEMSQVWNNAAMLQKGVGSQPVLSICVPFFKFPVARLVRELIGQIVATRLSVELLLADDASDDIRLAKELRGLAAAATFPVQITAFRTNQGRSLIRHHLTEAATGSYILFLDADMYPDSGEFVAHYCRIALQGKHDIVVGGRSYKRVSEVPPSCALYFYHSGRTECVPLSQRIKAPLQYVFTNNMMIRKAVMNKVAFDPEYVGWGYEDIDLAINAAHNGAAILHIDNSASHLGLIDDDVLIAKYKSSTMNFLRLLKKFPGEALKFKVFRLSSALARMPLPFRMLSAASEQIARASSLPRGVRYASLQSMKVFLYAMALRHAK